MSQQTKSRGGKKTVYSDPACKPTLLPVNPDGIPPALKNAKRWVLWKLALKDGRWTKVPVRANGQTASSTDPTTWCLYDDALRAYQSEQYDGIGFMLGDGVVGIDLDDVRDPNTGLIVVAWAADLMEATGTYAEVSPSGTGVKIFGLGSWTGGWHKRKHPAGGEIEVYSAGRYFTVTGECVGAKAVSDMQQELDRLKGLFATTNVAVSVPLADEAGRATNDELLDRIRGSKQGTKFAALYDRGDTSGHGGDDSASDLALCGILAYWVGPYPDRLDRLFRRSALMRPKWDEKRKDSTYGRLTIDKALANRTEFYSNDAPPVCAARPTDTTPTQPSEAWPDPIAEEAYHGLAGEIVRCLKPGSEADPVAVLIQFLVMFGNLVGREPRF